MDIKEIGARIRHISEIKGLHVSDLAKMTGLHVNTVKNVFDGRHELTLSTLGKFADVLNVAAGDLIRGIGRKANH